MTICLHVCCAPCTVYPLSLLLKEGIDVQGYFYNPNIHPFREFKKRMDTLKTYAESIDFKVEYEEEYMLDTYLRKVVFNENKRCSICYDIRLQKTVEYAKDIGAHAFSSTLLYSKYQQHNKIREKCEFLAKEYAIPFYYHDMREGWVEGIEKSIELKMYRQPYCGCIYSEQERYDKKFRKKR